MWCTVCRVWALKALLFCHFNHPNTWLGHPISMQWKSDFCCDRRGQWGHASTSAALQRLARRLSLRDGFRVCEEAPSWQPDASETLLHTFHLSTAWPGHAGIKMKRRGSVVVWGSHSYSRWHLIGTWLTSYTFITSSPESLNASPEPHSSCLEVIFYLASLKSATAPCLACSQLFVVPGVPHAWSKGFHPVVAMIRPTAH